MLSAQHALAVSFTLVALQVGCAGADSRQGNESSSGLAGSGGMSAAGSAHGGGTTAASEGGASESGGTRTSAAGAVAANAGGTIGSAGARNDASGGAQNGGASGAAAGGAATGGTAGPAPGSGGATSTTSPRLFYLDIGGGRVLSAKPDGSDVRVLVRGASSLPDGVAVDTAAGHVFWTNMGLPSSNDGFIDRVDLDGGNQTVPVAVGQTFTPKQLKLDAANGKLYWADREGMRIQRANLDGTKLETLVETGSGDTARLDASNWCVGIALDVPGKKIYWTQKGGDNAGVGTLRRAGIDVPDGQDPAHRTDVEVLFDKLPEPIDLDVDLTTRQIYWTDRGNPPRGNTVNRAAMDPPAAGAAKMDPEILVSGLAEGIGISLDIPHGVMYFTDLGGTVYVANLDGSGEKKLITGQGSLTGISYVELPQ